MSINDRAICRTSGFPPWACIDAAGNVIGRQARPRTKLLLDRYDAVRRGGTMSPYNRSSCCQE
jgi:hypothetical protein